MLLADAGGVHFYNIITSYDRLQTVYPYVVC